MDCKATKSALRGRLAIRLGRCASRPASSPNRLLQFLQAREDAHNNPSFYQQLGKTARSVDGKRTGNVGEEVRADAPTLPRCREPPPALMPANYARKPTKLISVVPITGGVRSGCGFRRSRPGITG